MSDVHAVIKRALGASPSRVRSIPTVTGNEVLDVELPTGRVIFKASPLQADIDVESWALAMFHQAGASVPRVLACDLAPLDYPNAFMIVEKLTGVSGERLATREAFVELGEQLRAVHEVTLGGFGSLERDVNGIMRGTQGTWPEGVQETLDWCLGPLAGYGLIGDQDADQLRGAVSALRPLAAGRLTHGDLREDHVFLSAEGALQGVIDPFPYSAHPCWDFARLAVDRPDLADAMLTGYGRDHWDEPTYATCLLVRLTSALYWRALSGGDTRSRLAHLRRCLDDR